MKLLTLLTFLFLTVVTLPGLAQTLMPYQQMEDNGFDKAELDERYPNSLHPDEAEGPFHQRQGKFGEAFADFYEAMMLYLNEHGYFWGGETWCHISLYFNQKGSVEHAFYNFQKDDAKNKERSDEFERLLMEFFQNHKIGIEGTSDFRQCAGVTFTDEMEPEP